MWFFRCNHRNLLNHWNLEIFRKTLQKNITYYFSFLPKNRFFLLKNENWFWNRDILIDQKKAHQNSNQTIRIQNFHFSRNLWWKNCWKLSKLLFAENRIVCNLSEISIPNFGPVINKDMQTSPPLPIRFAPIFMKDVHSAASNEK